MENTTQYSFSTLFYEATRRCNFACDMCMAGSNDHELVKQSVKKELDTDEIEKYILGTAHEIGIQSITWSGGEFILRSDAVELVRRATKYNYVSTICTNGAKITRKRLLALKEASGGTLVIAVGINSISEDNAETRDADSDLAMQVLNLCKELDIKRHVVVAIGQHNRDTVGKTLQWLEDNNIPYNRSPFTARNSGRDRWEELRVLKKDMEEKFHPELRKHPIGYISYTPFFLSPEVHDRYSKGVANVTVPQNPSIGCWCGTWLAVNAEGDVSPCGILLDEVNGGNVRENSFKEIIDQSSAFQKVLDRSQLSGKCGRCRYQYTCGGCRAMAWFESGDLMGEDPTCFFEPVDKNTVSENEEETNKMFKRYQFMARHAARGRT